MTAASERSGRAHVLRRRSRSRCGVRAARAPFAVTALLLVLLSCTAGACGSKDEPEPQNAVQRMRQILGRKPTGSAATIVQRGTLLIAVTPAYPPLSYYDDDGRLTGFDVAVGTAVAEHLRLAPRFTEPVWEAVPAGLQSDRFDVSIGSLSPDQGLAGAVSFSKPYYYTEGQLLVKAGTPRLKGIEALTGKRVGAGIHTVFYRWLQGNEELEVTAFPGDAEAFSALEAGRVDAVVVSGLAARQAVDSGRDVELSGRPLFAVPMTFVVKEGEKDLLLALDRAIAVLRKDGVLTELSRQWFDGQDLTRRTTATSPAP